ncbi:MAG: cob(I)yrinic acid a,c-diamide adenosyltransferase [Chloroflexi bacterium]|nr:cob(I)yrinic acid a,c-diamide adenosyltransferase [Chloroflexota bacterium]MCH8236383.1 cob(I)yrinic acid a,c-diamide adenosyltransferase [Chloroflexota bacterium]
MTTHARESRDSDSRNANGLVIIHTGDGKGKTTAALGLMVRAWGQGMTVRMFQFLKHTGARFGEHRAAEKAGILIESRGDGFTWLSKDMDETTAIAVDQWNRCKEAIAAGETDLIVLDEATYPVTYGWLDPDEVVSAIVARPPHVHIVITGRDAHEKLIKIADVVTEMADIKHPYRDQGIKAQPGLDF